jgi:NADH:ubiquinone oxidoreductase subunit E
MLLIMSKRIDNIKITICVGSACHLKGSRLVVETLQSLIEEHNLGGKVELGGAFCLGNCNENGVSITINEKPYVVNPNNISDFFQKRILSDIQSN